MRKDICQHIAEDNKVRGQPFLWRNRCVYDTVEPEPELVAKYEERYQKFKKLYPTVKVLFTN